DWKRTKDWLFMIILIIIMYIPSLAQSDIKFLQKILGNIPTDSVRNDSAAMALEDQENLFLSGGDTIQAFTNHLQWKAYHISRSNTQNWGVNFEPYIDYAENHVW